MGGNLVVLTGYRHHHSAIGDEAEASPSADVSGFDLVLIGLGFVTIDDHILLHNCYLRFMIPLVLSKDLSGYQYIQVGAFGWCVVGVSYFDPSMIESDHQPGVIVADLIRSRCCENHNNIETGTQDKPQQQHRSKVCYSAHRTLTPANMLACRLLAAFEHRHYSCSCSHHMELRHSQTRLRPSFTRNLHVDYESFMKCVAFNRPI